MNKLELAKEIARAAHKFQKRKYTGEPYFIHCLNVRDILLQYTNEEDLLCIAILHDTIEDQPDFKVIINRIFEGEISNGVYHLTNPFTKEKYPDLNRYQRFLLEKDRLSQIPDKIKNIKLCDLLDNTADIVKNDLEFAKIYIREKLELLSVLNGEGVFPVLYQRASDQVRKFYEQLQNTLINK